MTTAPIADRDTPTSPTTTPRAPAPWRLRLTRHGPTLALFAALVLHGALVLNFAPPSVIFSREPIYDIDYALHYYQVDRAHTAYSQSKRLWGYDPLLLAGNPAGALEDISSKSLELFVIALTRCGVHQATAFNCYVLLVHLALPFVAWLAAVLFGLRRYEVFVVVLTWTLLWFFDSFLHWIWFCGMISWAAVAYLSVLFIALFYRALSSQRARHLVPLALLAAVLALMHPFGSLTLLPPCAVLYLVRLRRLSRFTHGMLAVGVVLAVLTALIWLGPALAMRHYLLSDQTFMRPSPGYLVLDYFDLLKDGYQTGPPVRTMLRFLCLVGAAVALWRWHRLRDDRALPIAVSLLAGLAFAYFGGCLELLSRSQPYRQIAPTVFLATIPLAWLLCEAIAAAHRHGIDPSLRVLLGLLLLLVIPRFARNVLFYFPEWLPAQVAHQGEGDAALVRQPSALAGLYEPRPIALRHGHAPEAAAQLRDWLEQNLKGRGRVVVQDYMLGEYLAATSQVPILGGLPERCIQHADSHLFRLSRSGNLPGDGLRQYFERYAVRYVVVTEPKPDLEFRRDLLRVVRFFGPLHIRLYETTIEPSYLMSGAGKVTYQGFNRLAVAEARGPEVALRFHWMEGLRCRPGCAVQRYPVSGDRVGFIRVPTPPPSFEIYKTY